MQHTNHPFRKENDLPNPYDYVPAVNLPGCIHKIGKSGCDRFGMVFRDPNSKAKRRKKRPPTFWGMFKGHELNHWLSGSNSNHLTIPKTSL